MFFFPLLFSYHYYIYYLLWKGPGRANFKPVERCEKSASAVLNKFENGTNLKMANRFKTTAITLNSEKKSFRKMSAEK